MINWKRVHTTVHTVPKGSEEQKFQEGCWSSEVTDIQSTYNEDLLRMIMGKAEGHFHKQGHWIAMKEVA